MLFDDKKSKDKEEMFGIGGKKKKKKHEKKDGLMKL